ncbi:hypothetical protein I5535_10190 [Rhodobacteraceae bacterium F11138]|nr:hypothetical protein [Rhodobacteraceae bacterium F11138]
MGTLLIVVIGGIGSIILLLHLTGRSRKRELTPEDARTAWHRHFPEDQIHDVIVSRDGHSGLVTTDQGPGLIWSFGADTAARHLRNFDFVEKTNGQAIRFHDFTAPRVDLHLAEPELDRWRQIMGLA